MVEEIQKLSVCKFTAILLLVSLIPNLGKSQIEERARPISDEAKQRSQVLGESAVKLLYETWDFPAAKETLDRALALNPRNASARADLAWYHVLYERYDVAVREMNKAVVDEASNPLWSAWLGWIHLWKGNLSAAEAAVDECLRIDRDYAEGLHVRSKILYAQGRIDEALAHHEKAASLDATWHYALAQTYALAGKKEKAMASLESLAETQWNTYGRVKIYLALGQESQAKYWLQRAYDQRHMYFPWLGQDTDLINLRGTEEFQRLYASLQLP